MARYLTPSKVALLSLIQIYCDSVIPAPSTIPLLSFIVSHISPISTDPGSDQALQDARGPLLSAADFNIDALKGEAGGLPGRTTFDLFVKRLWKIDTLDALHVFFQSLDELFKRTAQNGGSSEEMQLVAGEENEKQRIALSRASPLGLFVRRADLEFTRLQFSDALKLWTAFLEFRRPTLERLTRLEGVGRASGGLEARTSRWALQELVLDDGDQFGESANGDAENVSSQNWAGNGTMMSASDVERLLEFQTEKMQRLGTPLPQEMKEQLASMLASSSAVPSLVHFVRFLDSWRAGDYTSSFDNLHRYFDHTLHSTSTSSSASSKTIYQYALLHMAILHADFGCLTEAVAAMNETVATARENQDLACLNFILNWLNHLNRVHPKEMRRAAGTVGVGSVIGMGMGSEKDALVFLKSRAREMGMWPLVSEALMGEARLGLSQGENLLRVFEHVYQSSHLIASHCLWGNTGGQLITESSAYARLGQIDTSLSYNDCLLSCYGGIAAAEDIARARYRKAFQLALYGQYGKVYSIIDTTDPSDGPTTLKLGQQKVIWTGIVRLLHSLRKSDDQTSEDLISRLSASATADPDASHALAILTIGYLIQTNQLPAAFQRLHDFSQQFNPDSGELASADIALRVQLMVLKARIFREAGHPQKSFSIAMRAAAMSQRAVAMPGLWSALRELCDTLNSVEEFDAVVQLLDAVIPQVHEGGDLKLLAELYDVLTDACVGLEGRQQAQAGQRQSVIDTEDSEITQPRLWRSWISKAKLYLGRAERYYSMAEDKNGTEQCFAKKAALANVSGDGEAARQYAEIVND